MHRHLLAIATLSACALAMAGCSNSGPDSGSGPSASSDKVDVVASTNVWGSVAQAIGGDKVNVHSIINSPDQLIGAVDDGVDIDLVSADRLGDRAPDVSRSDDVNLVGTGGRAGSRVRPGVGAACHCQSTGAESGNGQKMSMHV